MAAKSDRPSVHIDFPGDRGRLVLEGRMGTPHLLLSARLMLEAAMTEADRCGCEGCVVLRRELPAVVASITRIEDMAEAAFDRPIGRA